MIGNDGRRKLLRRPKRSTNEAVVPLKKKKKKKGSHRKHQLVTFTYDVFKVPFRLTQYYSRRRTARRMFYVPFN